MPISEAVAAFSASAWAAQPSKGRLSQEPDSHGSRALATILRLNHRGPQAHSGPHTAPLQGANHGPHSYTKELLHYPNAAVFVSHGCLEV